MSSVQVGLCSSQSLLDPEWTKARNLYRMTEHTSAPNISFCGQIPAYLNAYLSSPTNTGSLCHKHPDSSCFLDAYCLTWTPEVGGIDFVCRTFLWITRVCFVNIYFSHPHITWENFSYDLH